MAREAALAADMAQRMVSSKSKSNMYDVDDDFKSQTSSVESVHSGEHQIMSAPATARAAGTSKPGEHEKPPIETVQARKGRREAVDLHQFVSELTPWHSRPPPAREDLFRVMKALQMFEPGAGGTSPRSAMRSPRFMSPRSKSAPAHGRIMASPRLPGGQAKERQQARHQDC